MDDMNFLKKLGEENEEKPSGSTINGMTAEEYATILDMKEENGIDEPIYPHQPSPLGLTGEELASMVIEDMEAPPQAPRPASEKNEGAPKRYSENSYGNSAFMSAAGDYRNIRERRMDTAVDSAERTGLGFIGALFGTVLAMSLWAAFAWAGYVTWLGALLIVAGAYFGYLAFARDIGASGVLIICLFIIAGVYLGNRLCFAVSVYNMREYSGTVYRTFTQKIISTKDIFVKEGKFLDKYGMKNSYQNNLIIGYFADVVAAGILFIRRFR